MTKYYRVKRDTFLWEEGAILRENEQRNGYIPLQDVWNKTENQSEYITKNLIENNPDWFERVYEGSIDKLTFVTKEQLKKVYTAFIS